MSYILMIQHSNIVKSRCNFSKKKALHNHILDIFIRFFNQNTKSLSLPTVLQCFTPKYSSSSNCKKQLQN
jgi:hypothetical protein